MMQPVHVSAHHTLTTAMYGSAPARAIIIAIRFRLDRLWLAMLNVLQRVQCGQASSGFGKALLVAQSYHIAR